MKSLEIKMFVKVALKQMKKWIKLRDQIVGFENCYN